MRSSAALSALIRLCPTDDRITCFYYFVHNQIGYPSSALSSTDNDTWEKKCYLFLVTLISARPKLCWRKLGYNNLLEDHPSLKKTLLKLVNAWRYVFCMNSQPFLIDVHSSPNKDAFAIMSEASLYYAKAVYGYYAIWPSPTLDSEYWEVMYLFTIFIVRFIPFIYYNSAQHTCGQRAQQLYHMLLLTFLRWLDSILYEFVARSDFKTCDSTTPHLLQSKLAIHDLLMQYVESHVHFLCSDMSPDTATPYLQHYFLQHHIACIYIKNLSHLTSVFSQGIDDTMENI